MKQILHFSKMHSLGNDFIVMDAIRQTIDLTAVQVSHLADRHTGIGCDQLLLIESPRKPDTDFYYRIFNADGSESGQCGNGARCLAQFAVDQGLTRKKNLCFETRTSLLQLWFHDNADITVNMGMPIFTPSLSTFILENEAVIASVLNIGNPHAVLIVDDIDTAPVAMIGEQLAKHAAFPESVNVEFMQIRDRNTIGLRVYERGVGETLACGSGACAAVVAGIIQKKLDHTVRVMLPGGTLRVSWLEENQGVLLTGSATTVFTGQITV